MADNSTDSARVSADEAAAIASRYRAVRERIDAACVAANREPSAVTLVAVSKGHPVDAIRAAERAGCLDFGENRVQSWRDKRSELSRRLRWHLIGPLQRNKVKYVVGEITLLHTLDSEALVDEFEKRSEVVQDALIEVNLGAEPQKAGVAPGDVLALARRCAQSPVIRPVGLMCIPPFTDDPEDSRPHYRALAALCAEVAQALGRDDELVGREFRELSMGMTSDYEVAVQEGATIVRVGTAIFGPRT
jgi:pyridoxal phosphate enzyme (YggS family)